MSSREIIDLILGKYKTKCGTLSSFVSNDNLSSFYISQQRSNNLPPVQIRLSNHGTYLRTWVDRVNLNNSKGRLFNPSHCINISIVFLDEDGDLTNDCEGQINCDDCQITPCIPQTFEGQNELGHSFTVYQFVYKSKCIKRRYIDGIVNAIISALKQGVYKDSLANIEQKASTKELKSNYTPQNTSVNKNKTNENKEYKINKNMKKQVIRLTESDLKNIIKESVNNILSELDWKTYQSASDKSLSRAGSEFNRQNVDYDKVQKYLKRAKDFDDEATFRFNQDYEYNDPRRYNQYHKTTLDDFDYLDDNYHNFRKFVFSHWGKSLDELSREECIFYKQCYLKKLGITSRLKSNKHNENYDEILYNMSPYRYIQYGDEDALQFASDEVLNAAHKGNKEIKDYTNRNYEYQKGKGWVKKQK